MLKRFISSLRKVSDSIKKSKEGSLGHGIETFIIPEYCPIKPKKYPLGIQPGTYSKKELAEAIHFIADLMEE